MLFSRKRRRTRSARVDNGNIVKQDKTIFYNVFASMMTARESCMNCKFATLNKVADYTVGDFHGYHCVGKEKGVSLVIANNRRAIELMSNAKGLNIVPETWVKAVNSNPRLYNGYDFVQYHPGVIFRNKLIGSEMFKGMCLNKGIFRLLWLPFKAITKIVIKFKHVKTIEIATILDNKQ